MKAIANAEITEVFETLSYTVANKMLLRGWKLKKIVYTHWDASQKRHITKYILVKFVSSDVCSSELLQNLPKVKVKK